jgi:hypothetical protein
MDDHCVPASAVVPVVLDITSTKALERAPEATLISPTLAPALVLVPEAMAMDAVLPAAVPSAPLTASHSGENTQSRAGGRASRGRHGYRHILARARIITARDTSCTTCRA